MAQTDAGSRDRILTRIRTALKTPATLHESAGHVHAGPAEIFAPIADPLERFRFECSTNNTELLVVPNAAAAVEAAKAVLDSIPEGAIFVQDAPELRSGAKNWAATRSLRWSNEGGPLETSQASITLAESLVAQTGSVFISSACGGRGASVAAPVHIVFATREQLVPDIDSAFARATERGAAGRNSYLCLITGSSRTADIEKILVMGAHGPRRLVVILALS